MVGAVRFLGPTGHSLRDEGVCEIQEHAMSPEEAIIWYEVGLGFVFSMIGGPFLVVVVVRWVRSFLSV